MDLAERVDVEAKSASFGVDDYHAWARRVPWIVADNDSTRGLVLMWQEPRGGAMLVGWRGGRGWHPRWSELLGTTERPWSGTWWQGQVG